MTRFHLHLVSDSTGDTVHALARACLVQFEAAEPIEHFWSMVRTKSQLGRVMTGVEANPGVVLYTLVNESLRAPLQEHCRRLQVPSIPILDPVIGALTAYLGSQSRNLPGRQHTLDNEYFQRIDAMQFALNHDDGQSAWGLDLADVVLIGVSRTSKTPTCIYLANRGVKAANIPIVPGVPLPEELFRAKRPLIVGLTTDPERLIQIRRNRLTSLHENQSTDYIEVDAVRQEVIMARRVCAANHWPVIDVSRRSIEETAAAILNLLTRRQTSVAAPE